MKQFATDPRFAGTPVEKMKLALREFKLACRTASLAEERFHSDQRASMGTPDKAAYSFARQAAISVVHGVQRLWYRLGGRDLTKPLVRQSDAFKDMCNDDNRSYTKYGHVGNYMFKWVADQMTPEDCHLCIRATLVVIVHTSHHCEQPGPSSMSSLCLKLLFVLNH